jgi:hypothetical protein
MIVTAIVLAIIAALCDYFFGIAEPWRKVILVGIVVVLVVGIVMLFVPDLIPLHIGRV